MAHRGHRAAYPEQTMPAYAAAIELGCRAIEADLQLTRDGHLVMLHDLTVDRTTDGSGPVAAMTLAEVRGLDAGSWFDPRFAGTCIPTLDEFLDLAVAADVLLCLEVKGTPADAPATAEALARTLVDRDLVDRMYMSSFDHAALAAARALVPDLMTAPERLPEDGPSDLDEAVRQARASRATVLQHRWEYLTPEIVEALHDAGIGVWAWPTDSPESIDVSVRCGVDAVIGDDVAWLLAEVARVTTATGSVA